jgi:nucleotide-binding universal stress UspA family protein
MDLEWIIATDLTPRSHGALRFAQWLHASAEPPGPRMTAVHVVNPRSSGAEYPGDAPVLARARELTRASVEAIGAATCFAAIEAIEGVRADEALAQLASSSGSGLIVGRAGEASTWSLVNLGPTARRLLRSVPGPLCVVPPDMHSIGDGPVLVAVSDAPHSEPAARFAIDLARSLHRSSTPARSWRSATPLACASSDGSRKRACPSSPRRSSTSGIPGPRSSAKPRTTAPRSSCVDRDGSVFGTACCSRASVPISPRMPTGR